MFDPMLERLRGLGSIFTPAGMAESFDSLIQAISGCGSIHHDVDGGEVHFEGDHPTGVDCEETTTMRVTQHDASECAWAAIFEGKVKFKSPAHLLRRWTPTATWVDDTDLPYADGYDLKSGKALRVYLPRGDAWRDPNVRANGQTYNYLFGEDGNAYCTSEYMDDKIGTIKSWGIVGGTGWSLPDGWLLCDGNNGTPDLTSRFIYGTATASECGDTLGASTHSHDDHTGITTDSGGSSTPTTSSATTGITIDSYAGGPTSVGYADLTVYEDEPTEGVPGVCLCIWSGYTCGTHEFPLSFDVVASTNVEDHDGNLIPIDGATGTIVWQAGSGMWEGNITTGSDTFAIEGTCQTSPSDGIDLVITHTVGSTTGENSAGAFFAAIDDTATCTLSAQLDCSEGVTDMIVCTDDCGGFVPLEFDVDFTGTTLCDDINGATGTITWNEANQRYEGTADNGGTTYTVMMECGGTSSADYDITVSNGGDSTDGENVTFSATNPWAGSALEQGGTLSTCDEGWELAISVASGMTTGSTTITLTDTDEGACGETTPGTSGCGEAGTCGYIEDGGHSHVTGSHTHTLTDGGHTHTVTIASHTHTVGDLSHSSADHTPPAAKVLFVIRVH